MEVSFTRRLALSFATCFAALPLPALAQTLTDGRLNVLPEHQQVYYCSGGPDTGSPVRVCGLKSTGATVYHAYQERTTILAQGYVVSRLPNGGYTLSVSPPFYGTAQ